MSQMSAMCAHPLVSKEVQLCVASIATDLTANTYNENKIRPRMELWGTPQDTFRGEKRRRKIVS